MSPDCAWGNGPLLRPYRVTYRVAHNDAHGA
jgi:hypothetical protein